MASFNYSKDKVRFQVTQYKRDTVFNISRKGIVTGVPGVRGKIKSFSDKSRRRFMLTVRNAANNWISIIHLTYPSVFPTDIVVSKSNLNAFLQWIRRKGAKYVWVQEYQERGAVHYHLICDKFIDKNEISYRWYHIVGSGDIKHLSSGTRVEAIRKKDGAIAYLAAYWKKESQKVIPDNVRNNGRFWGCSRGTLQSISLVVVKRASLNSLKKEFRNVRRYYQRKLQSWGIHGWKWGKNGFIAWDTSLFIDRFLSTINLKGGLPVCT